MSILSNAFGLLAAALALYGAYNHGVTVTDGRWRAKWAEHVAEKAEGRAQAEITARAEEQRRQLVANEIGRYAREKIESAAVDAADADRAGQRLRNEAKQLAAMSNQCPGDSGAAERSQAATRAAMVLSDLLARADQRAGELAEAYDRARLGGLICESMYDQ
jgi:hypothetical protein